MDLHDYEDVAENYDLYLDAMYRNEDNHSGFQEFYLDFAREYGREGVIEKTLPTLIQTNETKKSTQIDAFFESKPKIDAFLKIDANAQRQEYKMAS